VATGFRKRSCSGNSVPVAIWGRFCHIAALSAARPKGCRGGAFAQPKQRRARPQDGRGRFVGSAVEEMTQMPKMKTKSGAKKRFKITAGGKVLSAHAGKRHGMIKRTNKQILQHRGTRVLFKTDGDNVRKYFLPNG
jgi:large subunit ribosomal protein L35